MLKVCACCGGPFEAKQARRRFCGENCRKRHIRHGEGAHPVPDGRQRAAARHEPGPVEKQVRADVDALVTAHPMGESLAEMSFSLARVLDQGMGGMGAAAVNRELRENLIELARLADDDDDELADELSEPDLPS